MGQLKSKQNRSHQFLIVTLLTMVALVGLFVLIDSSINPQVNIASAQTVPNPEPPERDIPTNVGILPPGQSSISSSSSTNTVPINNPNTPPSNYNLGHQTVRSGGDQIALTLIFITLSAGAVYLYYLKDNKNDLKTNEKKIL
jgi:hypothetical protein